MLKTESFGRPEKLELLLKHAPTEPVRARAFNHYRPSRSDPA